MPIREPIAEIIWDTKYRYRQDQKIIDVTIDDTWRRVAKAIAKAEKRSERAEWEQAFYHILENYQFLPGGRILAGSGTKHHVTLFNCFVMNIAKDSIPGIFNAIKEGALTLQQGGGVGYDFSILRPAGTLARKTGMPASGPVSFMKIWDTMCAVLLSTGARRGAMMGVLRCDHPDIEAFIEAKADAKELRHFNVSVLVTDAFMQAVKEHADWPLIFPSGSKQIYRHVNAHELWEKIIRSAYHYAEPGVLLGDTINRQNNLWYRENIAATNPCGEIPLPPYGACDLGAINLTQFVMSPFTKEARIDWHKLDETVRIATRFLDNVIDVSKYPLVHQREQARGTRRIGLGVTGLADVMVMLTIRYGDEKSIQLTQEIMKRISTITWLTSIDLAKEKGKFPFYDEKYLQGKFVQTLDHDLQRALKEYGVRNSHHNTIAPAGTISLFANNVSNGIEPVFRAQYERHVRGLNDDMHTYTVRDYAYHFWQHFQSEKKLPPAWIDAESLSPHAHLAVQAAAQQYVDNAISKTINVPETISLEEMMDVYSKAYELGLKGCTVFRPNPTTGSVLEVSRDKSSSEKCCSG